MRQLLALLLLSAPLLAAPIGNPATPGLINAGFFTPRYFWVKGTTGYLADYVSNMPLKLTHGTGDFDVKDAFKGFGLHSQMASLSLIFLQRLEAYALLGGSKEHLKFENEPETSLFSAIFEFQSTYHFSWAAGMRIILLQWGQTFFTIDGCYFEVPSSSSSYFKFLNRLKLPMEDNTQQFYLHEWQTGATLASRFWIITPFVGIDYLNATLHIASGPETTALEYTNRRRFGYFWGLTLNITSKILVTGERRIRDEYAYSISTQAAF